MKGLVLAEEDAHAAGDLDELLLVEGLTFLTVS